MTLRLSDLPGIKHRVLRWGKHVEVLAPDGLRNDVAEELRTAASHYANGGTSE